MNDWLDLLNTPEAGGLAGGVVRWLGYAENLKRLAANLFVGGSMAYYLAPVIIYSLGRYFEIPPDEFPVFEKVAGIGVGLCCGLVGISVIQLIETLFTKLRD